VTDGDEIDWAYGRHRIWMYTFELYPSHAKVSSTARFYPADELIERETERNKSAILYIIERAGCRYDVTGKTRTHCGPMFDDFEVATGWLVNRPARTRPRRDLATADPPRPASSSGPRHRAARRS
jgi:hypothetical protein